jgi:glycosyltransferase involved in cell wall biosynthesis
VKPKVAIVVPGLMDGGGVPAVGVFLHEAINRSGRYAADLISIAVYSRDAASVRLLSPMSWWAGPQEINGTWQGIPYKHIGSHLAEVEVARYMPRRLLSRRLNSYDVIQVVSGSPAFACVVSPLAKPKCLSVATTVAQDRRSALARESGLRRVWRAGMTGFNMMLERKILSCMDHVFAQSAYTHRLLAGLVSGGRLSMGPPGVDTSLFRPGRDSEKDYILSVARFSDPRKNVRMLFRAYALVRDELPDAPRLVLAGTDGPTPKDWALACELGISDRVEFRGNQTPEDLAQLYRGAALFALASNEEGFGIVLLEAMASGIAVVSTRCGGPESLIVEGQTGLLTPVGDHNAMAGSLIELLRDVNRRQEMGRKGRRLSEERFSIEVAGRAYLQVYDRLLEVKPLDVACEIGPQAFLGEA